MRCCCAATPPTATSGSTGTPRRACRPGATGASIILGTEGYLELRKYIDIAGRPGIDHLFVVDANGTEHIDCSDATLDYYPALVRDVRNRTDTACPQEHTFEVMRLAVLAQQQATLRGNAE